MSSRSQPPTRGSEPPPWGPWGLGSGSRRSRCGPPSPTREGKRRPPPRGGRLSCPRLTCPLCPAPAGSAGPGRWQRKLPGVGGEECGGRRPRGELGFLSCDPPRLPHRLAGRPGSGSEEGLLPAHVPLSPGQLAAQLEGAAEREGWKRQVRPKGCWHWGTGWFRVTAQVAEGSPRPLPKAGAGAAPLSGHRTADRRGSQHAGCRGTQDAGS